MIEQVFVVLVSFWKPYFLSALNRNVGAHSLPSWTPSCSSQTRPGLCWPRDRVPSILFTNVLGGGGWIAAAHRAVEGARDAAGSGELRRGGEGAGCERAGEHRLDRSLACPPPTVCAGHGCSGEPERGPPSPCRGHSCKRKDIPAAEAFLCP